MFRSHRLIAGFALACSSFAFANQGVVQIVDPGGHSISIEAMNNQGAVVGHISDSVGHAFMWDGTFHVLPDLGRGSYVFGINDNGDIIGYSYPADISLPSQLCKFTATTITPLGVTGVGAMTNLTNAGDFGYNKSGHAYVRNLYTNLEHEVATGTTNPFITQINDAGSIIADGGIYPGIFDNGGGPIGLFTLLGQVPATPNTGRFFALGEQDQVAGFGGTSSHSGNIYTYFLWDPTNGLQILPVNTIINDFNTAGDYVGQAPNPTTPQALYWHNGVPTSINGMMGPGPINAQSVPFINDAGQMVIYNGIRYYLFDPALVTNFDPTVVISGLGTFAYNGSPRAATAVAQGYSNAILSPAPTVTYTPGGSTAPTLPGTYQVLASYPGDVALKYNPASATGTITITKLNTTTTATGGTFAYDGNPHPATYVVKNNVGVVIPGAVATVIYIPGSVASVPVTPGTYSAFVSFAGDDIYNPSSGSTTVKINNPAPIVTVTGGTFTYNGVSHPATAVVTDSLTGQLISSPLPTFTYSPGGSTPPTNAGTYGVTANFPVNTNYPAASGTGSIVIQKADSSVTISGAGTFVYDGNNHGATAVVQDISNNVSLGNVATISYSPGGSTVPRNAGTYQVTATYAGTTNRNPSSATATIVIQKAATSVAVSGLGTFTYNGNSHAATATVHDDSNNVNLSGVTIAYSPGGATAPVNAGTYQVTATYAGDANHEAATDTGSIVIQGATTTVSVAGGTFAYDGNAHTATATVKNASNVALPGAAVNFTYTPGGSNAPTTPGTYQVTAEYAGDANYNPSTGTGSITITNPPPTVTVTGGTFDYTGGFHNATATVTDTVSGAVIGFASIGYTPGGHTGPINAGTYSVEAYFEAEGNYTFATGYGTIVINPVGTSVSVTGGTFSYNGNAHPATVVVSASNGSSMSGVLAAITYSPGGSSAPTMPGTYQVSASYAGDNNHNPSSGTGTIVITQPLPNVNVTGGTFQYNGTAHPATVSITDAATSQNIPGAATISYSPGGSNPPVAPGTYQVTASFAGNGSYPTAIGYGTIVVTNAHLSVAANNAAKALNAPVPSLGGTLSGVVPGDGITVTYTTVATQYSPIGTYAIIPVINDPLGRLGYYDVSRSNGTLLVVYGGNTGILQPINADGTSVFKQKSTVPAKFRVYDANGNSVCAPGTVVSFYIVQTVNGTVTSVVNEAVDSTTPDDQFRCDGNQWIFNISTKNLSANVTYYFRVTLADGSTVDFHFGLK